MLRMDAELLTEEGRAEDHIMHRQATIQEHAQPFQVTRVVIIPVAEPEQNIITTHGAIITMEIRTRTTVVLMIAEARHNITGQVPGITATQTAHGETADHAVVADSTADPVHTQPLQVQAVVEAVEEAAEIQDVPDGYCFA
jgi:hypothetical protein